MTIEQTVEQTTGQPVEQRRPDDLTLPLVDISRFRDPAQREQFLADLRHAAHDIGFFYVVGHGVPQEVTDAVLEQARLFFALPLEDRLAIENVNSRHFRGYSRVGTERTAGAADQRDQIDVGIEREPIAEVPADKPYLGAGRPEPVAARGARPEARGAHLARRGRPRLPRRAPGARRGAGPARDLLRPVVRLAGAHTPQGRPLPGP